MAFDTSQMSYVALRNIIAERTNGVVFWIGSGPSADVGVPTWAEFKDRLLEALLDKMHNLADQDRYSLEKAVRLVERQKNNWHAFEILRKELGNATWRSRIRELLRPYASTNAPLVYRKIWRLRPHGILTLNLDRLATKAYAEVDEGPVLTEFSGNQVADYAHVLKNPHPFICHLHGNIEDASSWILTYSDLKRQRESPSYQNFIRSCLSVKTVVFIGIGADDEAVGGFVEDLSNLGIDTGAHYWITERRDMATDRWAEEQGTRLIRYDAPDGNHVELSEMLDDLIAFVSADDAGTATPVIPVGLSPTTKTLSREADLLKMDAESLRNILNEEAGRLLVSLTPHAIEEYNQFSRVYDQAIYRAWYANTESGNNRLLGHILHEEAASGAFGTVYEATDEEGNHVAVKVLHEGIRRNADFLQAFRRGVRSMKILGDNSVQGMVPYRKAFEIPACVVMDWIDGPNLDDAVSSKQVQDWNLILRIGSDIADIVRRGHVLPERVLHRDLRPSNVMLRGFYTHPDKWEVVVLDFDLSWHRGALERSIIPGSAMLGYLAPEQIQSTSHVSTRHAAVDSFGMGMVLFFMMSGRAPLPDEHKHADWRNTLARAAHGHPCNEWRSAPSRFARLVELATRNNQSERWDMTQIQAELTRLHEAVSHSTSTQYAELIAEEIAARCEFSEDYEWDGDSLAAVKETPSGVRFTLQGDESQRRVFAILDWGEPGVQGRAYLGKWIEPARMTVQDNLRSFGWRIEDAISKYAHISISASLPAGEALEDMDGVVGSLDRALERVRF